MVLDPQVQIHLGLQGKYSSNAGAVLGSQLFSSDYVRSVTYARCHNYRRSGSKVRSVDHSFAVAAPKPDLVFRRSKQA